ncbi:MAG: DNA translocase FtsK 4TM domain-containing protein, partial [Burkholderiaceae bacterium]|nr:DNA translocase FtsK 4TM domain-containing protein [Burkholderiaceae bacterium]
MAYPLNTFNGSAAEPAPRSAIGRFTQELGLVLSLALIIFMTLALLSYSPQDAAWSTSGAGPSVHNWAGKLGAWLADLAYVLLGFSAWWCVAASLRAWVVSVLRWLHPDAQPTPVAPAGSPWARLMSIHWVQWAGLALLLVSSSGLEWSRLHRWDAALPGSAGGVLGHLGGPVAVKWLGLTGSALLGIAALVISTALVFRFSWSWLAERIGAALYELVQSRLARREIAHDVAMGKQAAREREEVVHHQREEIEEHRPAPVLIEPAAARVAKSARATKERQKPLFNELPDSKLPQVDLLDSAATQQDGVAPETLEMTSRLIEKKLKDFGVEVRVVAAAPGPVITRYEIEPATGVKGAQVVNLAKDLARSLSLVSIRVIETIPGKNFMALELPNARRQSIRLSEILGSRVYDDAKSLLTVGLGKDIIGNPMVADLAKMPHVMVAGTTGSGKSVGINAMILSLLYKAEPKDVRLLMIDPKMLELSVYDGIPHLLAPVVTDMKQAANGLLWCVAEMERRYKLMSKFSVRNLAGFNQ